MPKKGSTTTQTSSPDEFGQQARQQVWDRAMNLAQQPYQAYNGQRTAGVDPMTTNALNGAASTIRDFQNYKPGTLLSGDINAYQNPYQQSVINGVQGDYDRIRQQTSNQVNDAATQAHAFGGSRHGVAEGIALASTNRDEASQLAGLRSAGYTDAANRLSADQARQDAYQTQRLGSAGDLMNLGLSGGGYLRNVQQAGLDANYDNFLRQQGYGAQQLGMLSGTLGGLPQGGTSTNQQSGSGLGGILGGALSIGSQFLPGGALAGSLSGLFGGGGGFDVGPQEYINPVR